MDEERLKFILLGLERGMPLSSAMLFGLRFFSEWLDEKSIHWLNREMLGYLNDEAASLYARHDDLTSEDMAAASQNRFPYHRVVAGTWISWKRQGPCSVTGTAFCSVGIVEIEEWLASGQTEFVIEGESGKFAFVADSDELSGLYAACRAGTRSILARALVKMRQDRNRDQVDERTA